MDKETARQKIVELVEKYASQAEVYGDANYNEAQTRQDFINPLFKLLGWDMDNEKGLTQYLREVILENRVSVDGSFKHPDYSFRLGNTILFYVEAKKPSVNIKDNKEAAFQLRRYGWNTGLTLSILTNFREFAVYDCRVKPNPKDKACAARLTYFTYQDLTEKQKTFGEMRDGFDFLWDTFRQDCVSRGSFEKFIKDDGDRFKRGVVTVDDSFLLFLEDWRQQFATNIFRNNKNLTEWELNVAVQQILDRVVFLRFAEDRDIEHHGTLTKAVKTHEAGRCYSNLYKLFELADDKYNAGLFDMKNDSVSRCLIVDNKLLQNFVKGLYYPSPYDFQVMPVEILGSAYERFLGKTVRIISNRYVKVEVKPEVRKAGGVYYTPQYIVNYIVKNTVGKLLDGKTPKDASHIRIIDPACGSGSFLLGAYQYLLDWHQNYYATHSLPSKGLRSDPLTPDGQLTIEEKKRILSNNIFGVDIDVIAVEFAKLSLLLKCMEGEHANVFQRLKIYHERLLPNIDVNIRCGNSLIGNDFYTQNTDFSEKEQMKINAFDWELEFQQVFKHDGGFDFVICNPPWGADMFQYVDYLESHYPHSVQNHKDSFKTFIEKAYSLINASGQLGMIVPSAFLFQPRYTDIRRFLREETTIDYLWNVGDNVFSSKIVAPCCVFIVRKGKPRINHKVSFLDTSSTRNNEERTELAGKPYYKEIEQSSYRKTVAESFVSFYRELKQGEVFLEEVLNFKDAGINYQRVNVGLYEKGKSDLSSRLLYEGKQKRKRDVEYWKGTDINSYFILSETGRFVNIGVVNDLYENERVVLNSKYFSVIPKILWRQTASYPIATLDTRGVWFGRSVQSGTLREGIELDIRYVLAIMNSRFFRWIYEQSVLETGRVYPQVKWAKLAKLPFPLLVLSKKRDKQIHDKLVSSVDAMLQFKEQEHVAILHQKEIIRRRIAATERNINELVYQLYGLTDEEIAIVEGNG